MEAVLLRVHPHHELVPHDITQGPRGTHDRIGTKPDKVVAHQGNVDEPGVARLLGIVGVTNTGAVDGERARSVAPLVLPHGAIELVHQRRQGFDRWLRAPQIQQRERRIDELPTIGRVVERTVDVRRCKLDAELTAEFCGRC